MCAKSLAGHGGPAFCWPVLTWRGWVWQAARVETESISVGELLSDPANVRQHGARNLETIKASLARFGQQKPIVVDGNGVVVAGNGTLAAARELGWQSVHVVRSGLTGSDRTAYAIADNRTAELAEWDDAALAEQLSALAIDDAELLAAAGYDPGELEALADAVVGGGEVVEDEAPEPPADPVTKPGDLWELGDHRVLCGDCFGAGVFECDVILTDPPYDERTHRNALTIAASAAAALGRTLDDSTGVDFEAVDPARLVPVLLGAARRWVVAFCSVEMVGDYASAAGDAWVRAGVWDKINPAPQITGDRPGQAVEAMAIMHKKGRKRWSGGGRAAIWRHQSPRGIERPLHPTPKPVALMAELIGLFSEQGEQIADPFLGSGTTLIAAEQLGRRCYGVEISPAYCDVIVERWENLTGGKAKRVADG